MTEWYLYKSRSGHVTTFFQEDELDDVKRGVYGDLELVGKIETDLDPEVIRNTLIQRIYAENCELKATIEQIKHICGGVSLYA